MGYPGTSGSDFIDYLIADRIVVPPDQERFFSEKIAALPDTLWVTDTARALPAPPDRSAAGLPETGFVFCCFNHNWKITAPIFDVWMRLLAQVEGSVLWLLEGNMAIGANLRKEAAARGIAPERLIFAGRTTPEQHLARQQLADLFLITLPGTSFPARVAASILEAATLPDLIAADLAGYEALALKLARDPTALNAIRGRLADKSAMPLFDTARFTRNLEAAYIAMLEKA
jgi:predicted O-linked N-acetylglucosamine transferase (SPINDLY family)